MDTAFSANTRPVSRRSMITLAVATALVCLGLAAGATTASASFTCISLDPPTANNQLPQDTTHTVTATVRVSYDPVGHPSTAQIQDYSTWWLWYDYYEAQYPGTTKMDFYTNIFIPTLYPAACSDPNLPATLPVLPNAPVSFAITSGPSAGQTANATTDANGQATFTWSNSTAGTDNISASTFSNYTPPVGGNLPPADGSVDVLSSPVSATAVKNWLPPENPPVNPPVTPTGVPASVLSIPKKCQTRRFYITASTSGGTVRKIVLKIDGKTAKVKKTVKTKTGRKFLIDTGRYSSGTHRVTLTTYFTNGKRVTKTGKFKLCTVRTSQGRVSPNFTG